MDFTALAKQLGIICEQLGVKLATAESCTGGLVAAAVTSVSGSATWFERGFVTYSNLAKQQLLRVKKRTLIRYGAVSAETVKEMAEGALKQSAAQVSIAITGIAGPTGGTPDKPIGTIYFAWAKRGKETQTKLHNFTGDRSTIRTQAVEFVLQELIKFLS